MAGEETTEDDQPPAEANEETPAGEGTSTGAATDESPASPDEPPKTLTDDSDSTLVVDSKKDEDAEHESMETEETEPLTLPRLGAETPPILEPERSTTPPIDTERSTTPPLEPERSTTPPMEPERSTTPPMDTERSTTPPLDTERSTTLPLDTERSTTPPLDTERSTPPPLDDSLPPERMVADELMQAQTSTPSKSEEMVHPSKEEDLMLDEAVKALANVDDLVRDAFGDESAIDIDKLLADNSLADSSLQNDGDFFSSGRQSRGDRPISDSLCDLVQAPTGSAGGAAGFELDMAAVQSAGLMQRFVDESIGGILKDDKSRLDFGRFLEVMIPKLDIGNEQIVDLSACEVRDGQYQMNKKRKGEVSPKRRSVRVSDLETRTLADKIRAENLRLEEEARKGKKAAASFSPPKTETPPRSRKKEKKEKEKPEKEKTSTPARGTSKVINKKVKSKEIVETDSSDDEPLAPKNGSEKESENIDFSDFLTSLSPKSTKKSKTKDEVSIGGESLASSTTKKKRKKKEKGEVSKSEEVSKKKSSKKKENRDKSPEMSEVKSEVASDKEEDIEDEKIESREEKISDEEKDTETKEGKEESPKDKSPEKKDFYSVGVDLYAAFKSKKKADFVESRKGDEPELEHSKKPKKEKKKKEKEPKKEKVKEPKKENVKEPKKEKVKEPKKEKVKEEIHEEVAEESEPMATEEPEVEESETKEEQVKTPAVMDSSDDETAVKAARKEKVQRMESSDADSPVKPSRKEKLKRIDSSDAESPIKPSSRKAPILKSDDELSDVAMSDTEKSSIPAHFESKALFERMESEEWGNKQQQQAQPADDSPISSPERRTSPERPKSPEVATKKVPYKKVTLKDMRPVSIRLERLTVETLASYNLPEHVRKRLRRELRKIRGSRWDKPEPEVAKREGPEEIRGRSPERKASPVQKPPSPLRSRDSSRDESPKKSIKDDRDKSKDRSRSRSRSPVRKDQSREPSASRDRKRSDSERRDRSPERRRDDRSAERSRMGERSPSRDRRDDRRDRDRRDDDRRDDRDRERDRKDDKIRKDDRDRDRKDDRDRDRRDRDRDRDRDRHRKDDRHGRDKFGDRKREEKFERAGLPQKDKGKGMTFETQRPRPPKVPRPPHEVAQQYRPEPPRKEEPPAPAPEQTETPQAAKPLDATRTNVRKVLKDLLDKRAKHAYDNSQLLLADTEKLVADLESQMYGFYDQDAASAKYKNKFRSLVFTIRDPNNQGLFRRILLGLLSPATLASMTCDELTYKTVSEWAAPHASENSASSAPAQKKEEEKKAAIQKRVEESSKSQNPNADLLGSLIPMDTTSQHKMHLFDSNCRICQDKIRKEKRKKFLAEKAEKERANKPKEAVKEDVIQNQYANQQEKTLKPDSTSETRNKNVNKPQQKKFAQQNSMAALLKQLQGGNEDEVVEPSNDNVNQEPEYPEYPNNQNENSNSSWTNKNQSNTENSNSQWTNKNWSSNQTENSNSNSQWTSKNWSNSQEPQTQTHLSNHGQNSEFAANNESYDNSYVDDTMDIDDDDDDGGFANGGIEEFGKGGETKIPGLGLDENETVEAVVKEETVCEVTTTTGMPTAGGDSPDSLFSTDKSLKKTSELDRPVWKGFVSMLDLPRFFTKALSVSGPTDYLWKDLPDTVNMCGRIKPDDVFSYLSQMKRMMTKELIIVRLLPGGEDELDAFNALFNYLNKRNRCGVVGNNKKYIKDMYIIPLATNNPVPPVLLPFKGPGLSRDRKDMILGVIVRQVSLRPPDMGPEAHAKQEKHRKLRKKERKRRRKDKRKSKEWAAMKENLKEDDDSDSDSSSSVRSSLATSLSSAKHEQKVELDDDEIFDPDPANLQKILNQVISKEKPSKKKKRKEKKETESSSSSSSESEPPSPEKRKKISKSSGKKDVARREEEEEMKKVAKKAEKALKKEVREEPEPQPEAPEPMSVVASTAAKSMWKPLGDASGTAAAGTVWRNISVESQPHAPPAPAPVRAQTPEVVARVPLPAAPVSTPLPVLSSIPVPGAPVLPPPPPPSVSAPALQAIPAPLQSIPVPPQAIPTPPLAIHAPPQAIPAPPQPAAPPATEQGYRLTGVGIKNPAMYRPPPPPPGPPPPTAAAAAAADNVLQTSISTATSANLATHYPATNPSMNMLQAQAQAWAQSQIAQAQSLTFAGYPGGPPPPPPPPPSDPQMVPSLVDYGYGEESNSPRVFPDQTAAVVPDYQQQQLQHQQWMQQQQLHHQQQQQQRELHHQQQWQQFQEQIQAPAVTPLMDLQVPAPQQPAQPAQYQLTEDDDIYKQMQDQYQTELLNQVAESEDPYATAKGIFVENPDLRENEVFMKRISDCIKHTSEALVQAAASFHGQEFQEEAAQKQQDHFQDHRFEGRQDSIEDRLQGQKDFLEQRMQGLHNFPGEGFEEAQEHMHPGQVKQRMQGQHNFPGEFGGARVQRHPSQGGFPDQRFQRREQFEEHRFEGREEVIPRYGQEPVQTRFGQDENVQAHQEADVDESYYAQDYDGRGAVEGSASENQDLTGGMMDHFIPGQGQRTRPSRWSSGPQQSDSPVPMTVPAHMQEWDEGSRSTASPFSEPLTKESSLPKLPPLEKPFSERISLMNKLPILTNQMAVLQKKPEPVADDPNKTWDNADKVSTGLPPWQQPQTSKRKRNRKKKPKVEEEDDEGESEASNFLIRRTMLFLPEPDQPPQRKNTETSKAQTNPEPTAETDKSVASNFLIRRTNLFGPQPEQNRTEIQRPTVSNETPKTTVPREELPKPQPVIIPSVEQFLQKVISQRDETPKLDASVAAETAGKESAEKGLTDRGEVKPTEAVAEREASGIVPVTDAEKPADATVVAATTGAGEAKADVNADDDMMDVEDTSTLNTIEATDVPIQSSTSVHNQTAPTVTPLMQLPLAAQAPEPVDNVALMQSNIKELMIGLGEAKKKNLLAMTQMLSSTGASVVDFKDTIEKHLVEIVETGAVGADKIGEIRHVLGELNKLAAAPKPLVPPVDSRQNELRELERREAELRSRENLSKNKKKADELRQLEQQEMELRQRERMIRRTIIPGLHNEPTREPEPSPRGRREEARRRGSPERRHARAPLLPLQSDRDRTELESSSRFRDDRSDHPPDRRDQMDRLCMDDRDRRRPDELPCFPAAPPPPRFRDGHGHSRGGPRGNRPEGPIPRGNGPEGPIFRDDPDARFMDDSRGFHDRGPRRGGPSFDEDRMGPSGFMDDRRGGNGPPFMNDRRGGPPFMNDRRDGPPFMDDRRDGPPFMKDRRGDMPPFVDDRRGDIPMDERRDFGPPMRGHFMGRGRGRGGPMLLGPFDTEPNNYGPDYPDEGLDFPPRGRSRGGGPPPRGRRGRWPR